MSININSINRSHPTLLISLWYLTSLYFSRAACTSQFL